MGRHEITDDTNTVEEDKETSERTGRTEGEDPSSVADNDDSKLGPTIESKDERELLLNQYIHYGEAAIATSNQRVKTNRFFGALLASVLAGLFIFARGSLDSVSAVGLTFGGSAGFIVCTFWHRSIESYRRLNGTRYQILNLLEEELPAPVYRDEWRYLKKKDEPLQLLPNPDSDGSPHTSHTIVEKWLVRLLAIGYLLVILYGVGLLYLTYLHPLSATGLPLNVALVPVLLLVVVVAILFYHRYR